MRLLVYQVGFFFVDENSNFHVIKNYFCNVKLNLVNYIFNQIILFAMILT